MAGYKEFFNITIDHGYFNDNTNKVLYIIPTGRTKGVFYNTDLIYISTRSGISVSYNEDFKESLIASKEDDVSFLFYIKSRDQFFYNYTDLDHQYGNLLFLDSATAREDNGVSYLHSGDYVESGDEKEVGDKLFNHILEKEERIVPPVGVIQINLNDLITGEDISKSTLPRGYRIKFKAKETYWRYNIVRIHDHVFDKLVIQDTKNELEFSPEGQVGLSDGSLAERIISNKPILLQEFSDYHFQLKGIKDGQEKPLISKLSIPDKIQIIKEGGKSISDLYIYY